jgi:hypothetical protein
MPRLRRGRQPASHGEIRLRAALTKRACHACAAFRVILAEQEQTWQLAATPHA